MTYNTGNPVPSKDPRDLDDNAEAFDRFLQSSAASEPDRLGVQRKTWHQMELDAAALVSPNVSALAALTAAADRGVFFSAAVPATMGTYVLTSFVRSLGAAANASAFRSSIGAISSSDNITGSAAKLTAPRSITLTGDGSWTVNFDGSTNVTAALTLNTVPVAKGGTGATTAAAARGNLLAAASGANSDITSLTGLTTPLSLAQGGTGAAPTSFTNLSLQNSWVVTTTRRAGYRKFLDMVYLEVNIQSGTATDGTLIATLPAGFRPPNSFAVPVTSGPNVAPAIGTVGPRVVIDTDGTIKCQNCSNTLLGFVLSFSLV